MMDRIQYVSKAVLVTAVPEYPDSISNRLCKSRATYLRVAVGHGVGLYKRFPAGKLENWQIQNSYKWVNWEAMNTSHGLPYSVFEQF